MEISKWTSYTAIADAGCAGGSPSLSAARVDHGFPSQANCLKTSQVDETVGMAVRVVKNGRLGFAASSDFRRQRWIS